MHDEHDGLHDRFGLEGWFSGQESEEDSADGVDIGSDALCFAFSESLFGGHVAGGTECGAGGGETFFDPDLFC